MPQDTFHASKGETMFRLELTEQMTMVIAEALGNHPYKESAPVIAEIQKQVNSQMASRSRNGGIVNQEYDNVQHKPEHQ